MDPFQDIVAANRAYVEAGEHGSHPARPSRALAVVTCMDSRIDTFAPFGLELGEAHVIRVAGGRVTDDVLRSLALSTHALGTRSVAVIGHTDCGLHDPDGTLEDRLSELMGRSPRPREWHAFADVHAAVRDDCAQLLSWTDRPDGLTVAGYVLDVASGSLAEVAPPTTVEPVPS